MIQTETEGGNERGRVRRRRRGEEGEEAGEGGQQLDRAKSNSYYVTHATSAAMNQPEGHAKQNFLVRLEIKEDADACFLSSGDLLVTH